MNKSDKQLKRRAKFVQKAIKSPKSAARELRDISFSLGETKNTTDTIYALSELFCVSETTILRDLKKDI